MIAFILLCYLCTNFLQILALPLPQLVFPSDQNLCALCSNPSFIDSSIDYMDSIGYPIVNVNGPQLIPYVWPEQEISNTFASPQAEFLSNSYVNNKVYDPVEDVVRSSLSQLVQMSTNANDFAQQQNDFLNRMVDPNIV